MVSRAVALCGTELVDPPMRTLRAGPLSAEFDNGALRYIRFGGVEVLRAIAFLVRDENWGTFTPGARQPARSRSPAPASPSPTAAPAPTPRASWSTARRSPAGSDGSLDFEVVADPRTDVLTNRTGFIVLHPVDGVAGQPVRIVHVDGSEENSRFPQRSTRRCPFRDIRAVTHEVAPGTWATCTMEGDAFEMEDQRNWSDASYKTYVRPLTPPWPYTLPKGEPVTQAIRLAISGPAPAAARRRRSPCPGHHRRRRRHRCPAIGIGVPAEEAAPALDAGDLLRRLAPAVARLRHRPAAATTGRAELARYRALAELTGAEVVLEVITRGSLDPLAELTALARDADEAGLRPAAIASSRRRT